MRPSGSVRPRLARQFLTAAAHLLPFLALALAIRLFTGPTQAAQAQTVTPPFRVLLPAIRADATPSSFDKIDTAAASGQIDEETALLYTVYAVYLDPRLPAQYRGNDSSVEHAPRLDDILSRWGALSPATRAALVPFLTPPMYVGSWYDLRQKALAAVNAGGAAVAADDAALAAALTAVTAAAPTADMPVCNQIANGWGFKISTNDLVKIWFRPDAPAEAANATLLAQAIGGTIWPALAGLHGRLPVSDWTRKCNGGDGRTDLVFLNLAVLGYFMPLVDDPAWNPLTCAPVAGQVQIRRSLAGRDLIATATHELMHAFNASYSKSMPCSEYAWWNEATATWSVDYVYPDNQYEQLYGGVFVNNPQDSLESTQSFGIGGAAAGQLHPYGAYLFPFYLARVGGGPNLIPETWRQAANQDSLKAINAALPNGLKKDWAEFALRLWNQPPVDDFKKADKFVLTPKLHTPETPETLPGMAQWEEAVPAAGLAHMATRYYHYTFPDDNVRSVGFYNGLTFKLNPQRAFPYPGGPYLGQAYGQDTLPPEQKKGAHLWAIWKLAGHSDWEQPADWTDVTFRGFCRDVKAERITDLVLIYSNSEYADRNYKLQAAGYDPRLFLSNVGCYQWEGDVTYSVNTNGIVEKTALHVLWERQSFGPQYSMPTYFKMVKAEGTWTVSGGFGDCTAHGSGPVTVPADGAPQMVIWDRLLSGPAWRSYGGRGQLSPPLPYKYTLTCPGGSTTQDGQIDVWWEPPVGLNPETTFKAVKPNGVHIEDTDYREESFGTVKITETRVLDAKSEK